MWQRFTERARKVVFYAQEEAQKYGEGYVSTEHLLLGLVREPGSLAAQVLEQLSLSLERVRYEVDKQLPRGDMRPTSDMTLTPRAKRVIDLAYDEARNLNNNYIGTEHLLLGLVREGDGLAGRVLLKLGMDMEQTRQVVMDLQNQQGKPRTEPVEPRKAARGYTWEEYDESTQRAILLADEMAKSAGMPHVTPYYLLKALLAERDTSAIRALEKAGIDHEKLERAVDENQVWAEGAPPVQLSPNARFAIDRTITEASSIGQERVGADALLLGLVFGNREGIGQFIADLGGSLPKLRQAVVDLNGEG